MDRCPASTTPSRAWQDAVQSYLSRLQPAERAGFEAPSSPEECLTLLAKSQRRKSKLTRILSLMRPAIDELKRFEGAIDVVVQVNAGIASPIWGPLRVAITLATDHFRTLESIAMIIHKIISSLQRFYKYDQLFAHNPMVQDAIGALYCDYIDFCVRLARYYASSTLLTLFSSCDKDFREVSESIQFHSRNVDWAAHAAHVEETQRDMEEARLERQAHERGNIQRWLSPSTVDDDLRGHLSEYMAQSCDWLTSSTRFGSWLSENHPDQLPFFGVQGLPGCGKSITTAYTINYLKSLGHGVLYFFFKANDSEKSSLVQCLRTMLSQLLHNNANLYQYVEPVYRKSGRAIADSFNEVERGFLAALKGLTDRRTFLVIDALDEASRSKEVWSWFIRNVGALGHLRVFITTRPLPATLDDYTSLCYMLQLDNLESNGISEYVKARVDANPMVRNTGLGEEIVNILPSASSGIWLYARLMLDDIDRLPSVGQARRHLQMMPKGYTELYTQVMRTQEASFTALDLRLAQMLYLFLDVGDYLPSWLASAENCLQYETLELIFQCANGGEAVFDALSLARRVSGCLVQVTTASSEFAAERVSSAAYEVDFTHQTAGQYLQECVNLDASELPRTLLPQRLRHLHRSRVAMWYFTACDKSKTLLDELRPNGTRAWFGGQYFEMAYGLWNALHLDSLPSTLEADEAREAADILDTLTTYITSPACLRWVEMAIIINYEGGFPQLLWNAISAWEAGIKNSNHPFAPYATFSRARAYFFQNYSYILSVTGVGGEDTPPELLNAARNEVERDELARSIMELGKYWKYETSDRHEILVRTKFPTLTI